MEEKTKDSSDLTKLATKALQEVRLLFTDRHRWCRGTFKKLRPMHAGTFESFCLIGGINHVTNTSYDDDSAFLSISINYKARDMLNKAAAEVFNCSSIVTVNDKMGYKAAMEVLEHAIRTGKRKRKGSKGKGVG